MHPAGFEPATPCFHHRWEADMLTTAQRMRRLLIIKISRIETLIDLSMIDWHRCSVHDSAVDISIQTDNAVKLATG